MLFSKQDSGRERPGELIENCCRQTGWQISSREGDRYLLRLDDHHRLQYVQVRHRAGSALVLFVSWLPVRFPLEAAPSGLYARLLLRNFQLAHGSWVMEIAERVEACLGVCARVPAAVLTPTLFDTVCRELRDEVLGFHQELRDRFQGDFGQPVKESVPSSTPDGGIMFLDEPALPRVTAQIRRQLPPR